MTLSRFSRAVVALTPALALVVSGPAAGAAGSGSGTAGSGATAAQAALQTEAQELAGAIQADGQNLDQLAASYETAQIRSATLTREVRALEAKIAAGAATVAAARTALQQQAVLAYITGGGPLITGVPDAPGDDRTLAIAYAEIVAGGEQQAVDTYRAALDANVRQEAALLVARQRAASTLAEIRGDRAAATQAMTAREAALGQVKGKLAVLVAQVQQAQEAAVEASLAARHDLPPSSARVAPSPAGSTSPAQTHTTGSVAPSTVAPTTAPPLPSATTDPVDPPPTSSGPPTTSTPPTTDAPSNAPAPGYQTAIDYAYKQLGKPYQWGATGPDSFDCSGLTMMSWAAAGVSIPRVAQDQYDATTRIAIVDLEPGDLVFFGTDGADIVHVGIYIGGGDMIDAPETGQDVSIQSIYWSSLVGGGRVQE